MDARGSCGERNQVPGGEPKGGPQPAPQRVIGEGGDRDPSPRTPLRRRRSWSHRHGHDNRDGPARSGVGKPLGGQAAQGWGHQHCSAEPARSGQDLRGHPPEPEQTLTTDDAAGQHPAAGPVDGEPSLVPAFRSVPPSSSTKHCIHRRRHRRRQQRRDGSAPRRRQRIW